MSCGYHERVTFECEDGYLHDRDYDYIDPDNIDYPCPQCNKKKFFINQKELLEGIVQEYGYSQWEELIVWYAKTFKCNINEVYQFCRDTEELNKIKIPQDGGMNNIIYCKHDYTNWSEENV